MLKLYVDGQGERRSTIAGIFSGRRRPRAAKLPAKTQQDPYAHPPGDSYGLPFARMAQLLGGSPSTSSSVFFLELATKSTREKYPRNNNVPLKTTLVLPTILRSPSRITPISCK